MKRILSLILGLVMMMSSFYITALAENDDVQPQVQTDAAQDAYARLAGVGVTIEGDVLTAGDYVAALLQFTNSETKNNDNTFETARRMGLIDAALVRTMPITYRDAVRAALIFAGYKQMFEMRDVMSIANSNDLLDKITAAETDNLTKDAGALLLSNLLDVQVMEYFGDTYKNSGMTVLEKYFNMTQKRVEIVQVDKKNKKIYVRENNNIVTYFAAENLNYDRVSGGNQLVFINEYNEICYTGTTGNGFMFWDFVYTVNKNSDQSINYYIDQIEKMTFYNSKDKYKVSDDVIAFYGDEAVGNDAYPVCGAFVKALGYDNTITQLNIYSLTEGGLLKTFTGTRLSYTQGTVNDLVSGDISAVNDMTVVIDGNEKTLDDLKKDMVFDYWSNEDETSMVIAASSRKAVGEIMNYSSSEVKIADLYYNVSSNVYSYSRQMERYDTGFLLRPPAYVEAYIDDKCEIRYVKNVPEHDTKMTTIYGVVKKAWTEDDGEEKTIQIIPITGPGSGNEIMEYKVRNKLGNGSISFDYAKSVASDLDGKGFFKFTINTKDEICKIDPVEYMTNTVPINFNNTKETVSYKGFYLDDATMIVLYQIEGKFKVKTSTWATLWEYYQKGSDGIYLTVDYHPTDNPVPRFGLITGSVNLIEHGWNVGGFVSEMSYTEDDEYEVVMGNTTYTMDPKMVEQYGIKRDAFVQLRPRPFEKNGLVFDASTESKVIDLSGPISEWADILNDAYGAYDDSSPTGRLTIGRVILKGDKYIQFEVDGQPTSVFPVTSAFRASEIVDAQKRIYKDAPLDIDNPAWFQGSQALRNVRIGDEVMFLIENKDDFVQVSRIYYFNDGSVFGAR